MMVTAVRDSRSSRCEWANFPSRSCGNAVQLAGIPRSLRLRPWNHAVRPRGRCSALVRFALSLLRLCPACSVSSNLKFQSALSKQTGLSRSWRPVQRICFHLLPSGCSRKFSPCKTGAAQRCLRAETRRLVAHSERASPPLPGGRTQRLASLLATRLGR